MKEHTHIIQHGTLEEKYRKLRATLSADMIVLIRLGDFYEAFEQDAIDVAKILNITLTKRGNMKMAGIPYHSLETSVRTLVKANRKVALCEDHTKIP